MGTAAAGVGGVADDDAIWGRSDCVLGQGRGEGRENDCEDLGVHLEEQE